MHLDEATQILERLKAAFPVMSLDEPQAEVLLREMSLLHDPAILDEAVTNLIQREDKFPPIARIRSAYRSVNEARSLSRAALSASEGTGDKIPVWVHVWEWTRRETLTARQEARESELPANERNPVQMRDFPQLPEPLSPDAYTWDDYYQLEAEWMETGSPEFGALEILQGIA